MYYCGDEEEKEEATSLDEIYELEDILWDERRESWLEGEKNER